MGHEVCVTSFLHSGSCHASTAFDRTDGETVQATVWRARLYIARPLHAGSTPHHDEEIMKPSME